MQWLQSIDIDLFRYINGTLVNPVFDVLMPLVSGNAFFMPALVVGGLLLLWKGGLRGFLFLLMVALAVGLCDGWLCREIKEALGRQRPFLILSDVRCLIGKGGSGSMPSSHAANWF